jgi:hypothetical protein
MIQAAAYGFSAIVCQLFYNPPRLDSQVGSVANRLACVSYSLQETSFVMLYHMAILDGLGRICTLYWCFGIIFDGTDVGEESL